MYIIYFCIYIYIYIYTNVHLNESTYYEKIELQQH